MQANHSLPQSYFIINFSHPIPTDDNSIIRLIPDMSSFQILDIPVHLDLNQPLTPQVESLVNAAVVAANGNIRDIDFIRLPGYAEAAALIVNEFQARGYLPDIIRFAKAAGIIPPRFEAFEVLKLKPPSDTPKPHKEVAESLLKKRAEHFSDVLETIDNLSSNEILEALQEISYTYDSDPCRESMIFIVVSRLANLSERKRIPCPHGAAVVGTSQEVYRDDRPGNFHWTVSLVGGKNHPLWGQSSGSEETFAEAKQAADKFLKRL